MDQPMDQAMDHTMDHTINQETDRPQRSSKTPQASAFDVLTSGHEFYDHGYTEEEQNAADLPSTFEPVSANLHNSLSRLQSNGENNESVNDSDGDGVSPIQKSLSASTTAQHSFPSFLPSSSSSSSSLLAPSSPSPSVMSAAANRVTATMLGMRATSVTTNHSFFGRTKELIKLKSIHSTVMQKRSLQPCANSTSGDDQQESLPIYPAVLVWGKSGTGKSCLIEQFIDEACCTCNTNVINSSAPPPPSARIDNGNIHTRSNGAGRRNSNSSTNTSNSNSTNTCDGKTSPRHCSCCYVLRGKYDESTGGSEPFSAIIQALNDLVMQLQHGPPEELDRMRSLIRNAFDSEGSNGNTKQRNMSFTHADSTGTAEATAAAVNDNSDGNGETERSTTSSQLGLSQLIPLVPSLSILLSDDTNMSNPPIAPNLESPTASDDEAPVACTRMSVSSSELSSAQRPNAYDESSPAQGSQNSWNRLRYIFIQFMKTISTPTKPVYLFLDDLQWSSSAGLELVAMLISDPEMDNFMLLGAIRQDTDPQNDEIVDLKIDAPLRTSFLDRLIPPAGDRGDGNGGNGGDDDSNDGGSGSGGSQISNGMDHLEDETKQDHHLHLEQITITNLSLDDTTQWLSEMLDRPCDDPDLMVLTRKLHKKTGGNVFFTIKAIEELKRKNIIVFSRITFMWEWNLRSKSKNRISSAPLGFGKHHGFRGDSNDNDNHNDDNDSDSDDDLPISDNIVTAIENQLRQLSQDLQHVLSIASYIRARFDLFVLQRVMEQEQAYANCTNADTTLEDSQANQANANDSDQQPAPKSTFASASAPASAWTKARLISILQQAIAERLIIHSTTSRHTYQFAHDRIQQAAYGLVPYGEVRDKLRVRIGHCLLDIYAEAHPIDCMSTWGEGNRIDPNDHGKQRIHTERTEQDGGTTIVESLQREGPQEHPPHQRAHAFQQDDTLLFVAADHLNSVQTKDHMFSATMNLHVGETALGMAALASAAGYLRKASNALQRVRKPWEEHYGISLRLHQARAEAELSLGHFEIGYRLGNEAIDHAKTVDDKIQAHLSMALALGREDKHIESLSMSMRLGRMLGIVPRRFFLAHIVKDILTIKAYFKRHTDDDILALPLVEDYKTIMAVRTGCEIGDRSLVVGDPIPWMLETCKMLKMTIKYGISALSAMCFASMGTIFDMVMKDYASALRCVNIGRRILNLTKNDEARGLAGGLPLEFILRYSLPTEQIDPMVSETHQYAMQAGCFEVGIRTLQFRFIARYFQDSTLPELSNTINNVIRQSRIYRVAALDGVSRAILQLSQLLQGIQKVDWTDIVAQSQKDLKKNPPHPTQVFEVKFDFFASACAAYYSERYEIADRSMKKFRSIGDKGETFILVQQRLWMSGLVASAMYRTTKKRKYRSKLRSQVATLESMEKAKGNGLRLCRLLLEAEYQSLAHTKGDPLKVQRILDAYDAAIEAALDEPSTQIIALGYELAAEHLIRSKEEGGNKPTRRNDDGLKLEEVASDAAISRYLLQALERYHVWGCRLKIDCILRSRSQYVQDWVPVKEQPQTKTSRTAVGKTMGSIPSASNRAFSGDQ